MAIGRRTGGRLAIGGAEGGRLLIGGRLAGQGIELGLQVQLFRGLG